MPKCSACEKKCAPKDLELDGAGNVICRDCRGDVVEITLDRRGVTMRGKWGNATFNSTTPWSEVVDGAATVTDWLGSVHPFRVIKGGVDN